MTNWSPTFWPTKSAPPFTEAAEPYRFAGGESVTSPAANSIGGYFDANGPRFFVERFLPEIFTDESSKWGLLDHSNIARLFNDVSVADGTSGKTYYRCLLIQSDIAVTNLTCYLKQPTGSNIYVGICPTITDTLGGIYTERLLNENTSPGQSGYPAVSFSQPTSGSPLVLAASVAAGGVIAIWFKMVVASSATAVPYDVFDITFAGGGGGVGTYHYFNTIFKGISSVTISGQQDGGIVSLQYGEIYTISVLNSAGAATDPAASRVFMIASGSFQNSQRPIAARAHRKRMTGSLLYPAVKTATGLYRVDFKPPCAGHWQLLFDIGGGELMAQRSVEVSPIVLDS